MSLSFHVCLHPSQLIIGCHSTITSDDQRPTNFTDGTITGDVPEAKLKALEKSLAKNALTADNFQPGSGFTFFHSTGDEVVPYCNLESVRNTWGTNQIKALSYQSYVSLHVGTGSMFFTIYCGSLVDEILKGTWAPSEQSVG